MTRKVVVDVDAGTDDAVALLLLLTLEREKDFKIVGITCTHGNTTVNNVCRNVLTILQCINRLDVPVFRGAEGPLVRLENSNAVFTSFHGENGFGDKKFPVSKGSIQRENAVAALNRLARENIVIELICLGPLTNVALSLRTYPEFASRLRQVHIMGGNVTGVGNITPAAEFNFFKDPEAAHIVLSSLSCPVTVVPWECCLNNMLTMEERKAIGTITSPQMMLLNEIELELYEGEKFWNPCDAVLAATFLDEVAIMKSRKAYMTVELHGVYTRGQGVLEHQQKKSANVIVVDEINAGVFKKLVYKMASYVPTN